MKLVHLPIRVPDGDYCWDSTQTSEICHYFENEGGHGRCRLGFSVHDIAGRYKKDRNCACLKTEREKKA